MIVTIHQPDFLPWLGFFERWRISNLYIVLDDVQFLRRGWHHRDKIKTPQGIRWLTVPVKKSGRFAQLIKDVEIDYQNDWIDRHLNCIRESYSKASNYRFIYPKIKDIYGRRFKMLLDLNMSLLRFASGCLGINTPFVSASGFDIKDTGNERLIGLLQAVKGDIYLTGTGAADYLEPNKFTAAGIEVRWQKFDHPVYQQLHGNFKEGLSVLDFLMMSSAISSQ